MRAAPLQQIRRARPTRAFTLVELLISMSVGSVVAGGVVFLLWQTVTEQRNGFSDFTVEEQAYILQSKITSALRSMSANQGMTPDYTSGLYDSYGNLLGYSSIYVFYPSNGVYVTCNIKYSRSAGTVTYSTNLASPATTQVWVSNSTTVSLTNLCFSTSFNPDGSQDSSLVNVSFQMNDNGFSQQGSVNNPTSIDRNFAIQLRNDN